MTLHLDELKTAIVRDRKVGAVVFDVRPRPFGPGLKRRWPRPASEMASVFDEYVSRFKLLGIGVCWTEIMRPQAEDLLCRVLTCNMATHEELMPRLTAQAYAKCFLNQFSPTCQMVTKGPFKHAVLINGPPSTQKATINSGVVCTDHDKIGLLWIGDDN